MSNKLKTVEPHNLIRLIYISSVNTIEDSVFEHIQKHSNEFNKHNSIKGFLCNNSKYFLQCLEGTKQSVLNLMSRIYLDKHHKKVKVIILKRIKDYSFTDWRMRSLNLDNAKLIDEGKFISFKDFLPFEPYTWEPWYIETFIKVAKEYGDPKKYNNMITFDTLNCSFIEKYLLNNGLLFKLFILLLAASSIVMMMLNMDVFLMF